MHRLSVPSAAGHLVCATVLMSGCATAVFPERAALLEAGIHTIPAQPELERQLHSTRSQSADAVRSTRPTYHRTQLISYDFVRSILHLDALHPQRTGLVPVGVENGFSEQLHHALSIVGFDISLAREREQNDRFGETHRHVQYAMSPRLPEFAGVTAEDDYPAYLPPVIDPLISRHAQTARREAHLKRKTSVDLTSRVLPEPPLAPTGESRSRVYTFIVTAGELTLKRAYRVTSGAVIPLGPMQLQGATNEQLRLDDSVFSL